MGQKYDWRYWKVGLAQGSDALNDLDVLAKDLGLTRAEATRFLIVAFSKAKRGEWGPIFGGGVHQVVGVPSAAVQAPASAGQAEAQARKAKGAAFAAALDLDD